MTMSERKIGTINEISRQVFRKGCFVVLFCGLFLFASDRQALAEQLKDEKTTKDIASEEIELPFLEKDDGFVYKSTERSDPFMPFSPEFTEESGGESLEVLTGMRRFEPRQLTLVAIISNDNNESAAMVQGPGGKGYLINKGTRIGRRGVVEDIMPNRVIIKEKTYTRTGEQRYNTIELLLKKGED